MKKLITLFTMLFLAVLVNAQLTETGKGFLMTFDFEDGDATEVVEYEDVEIDWYEEDEVTTTWTIEDGALHWVQETTDDFNWIGFGLIFDPPIDLSENTNIAYKYMLAPDGEDGTFFIEWFDVDDEWGGEYFAADQEGYEPGLEEWTLDDGMDITDLEDSDDADPTQVMEVIFMMEGETATLEIWIDDIVIGDAEITSSVRPMQNGELVSVYPNPSYGNVSVQFSENVRNSSIEVFNSIGQKVYQIRQAGNYRNVDLSDLASGIYFIKASADSQVSTAKILLK